LDVRQESASFPGQSGNIFFAEAFLPETGLGTMERRTLQEDSMASWVVYHNDASPEVLEYVIQDVPAGTKKEEVVSALQVSREGCLVILGTDIAHSHGICVLDNAPVKTQTANAEGKASKTLRWGDLWSPTSIPR
jgi:hypothetical protein